MVDQPKCKDLICGYFNTRINPQEATVRVYANDATYKSSSPQPSPPLPRQHLLEAGLLNTVNIENKRCFKWSLTGGKSKTTIEKSGW